MVNIKINILRCTVSKIWNICVCPYWLQHTITEHYDTDANFWLKKKQTNVREGRERTHGSNPSRGMTFFLSAPNPPDRPPIQWIPAALPVGVQWPGRAGDHLHDARTLRMCTAKFPLRHNSFMACCLLAQSENLCRLLLMHVFLHFVLWKFFIVFLCCHRHKPSYNLLIT